MTRWFSNLTLAATLSLAANIAGAGDCILMGGVAIQTKDLGIFAENPGKPRRHMVEIAYHVQQEVSRSTLAGYSGNFNNYGLVDMRDPNSLVGLVRHQGEICK